MISAFIILLFTSAGMAMASSTSSTNNSMPGMDMSSSSSSANDSMPGMDMSGSSSSTNNSMPGMDMSGKDKNMNMSGSSSSSNDNMAGMDMGGGPIKEIPPNIKVLGTYGAVNLAFIVFGVWNKWFRRKEVFNGNSK